MWDDDLAAVACVVYSGYYVSAWYLWYVCLAGADSAGSSDDAGPCYSCGEDVYCDVGVVSSVPSASDVVADVGASDVSVADCDEVAEYVTDVVAWCY